MMQHPPKRCHDSEDYCANRLKDLPLTISHCSFLHPPPLSSCYGLEIYVLRPERDRLKHVYLATSPQRLTFGEVAGAVELRCCSTCPLGTLNALQKLLTPILSTQLACASLTHTGLLMATAS